MLRTSRAGISIDNLKMQYLWLANDNLIQKQPSCVKKVCGPQESFCEKRCEIQGGGQEMAVMVG